MTRLIHSAKFWAAVVAAVFNIASFVVAHYYPEAKELAVVVIASLDAVFAVVIGAFAYEDGKAKQANITTVDHYYSHKEDPAETSEPQ